VVVSSGAAPVVGQTRARRRYWAGVVTVCAAGIFATGGISGVKAVSSSRDDPAAQGTIALASSADFRTILLVSARSGAVTRVRAPDRIPGLQVDFSPDGSSLAFGGTRGIWTMSRRATRARRVIKVSSTETFAPDWVVWSPSGLALAFTRRETLYTVRTDGSRLVRVLKGHLYAPDWAPAGGVIAFVRNPSPLTGAGLIQTARANGTGVRSITRGGHPDISPDGSKLAFSRLDGIYVMPLQGGVARRVAVRGDHPEWSPDGRHLAFTREVRCGDAGCEGRVFIVPAGGGQPRAVGPRVFEIGPLSWSR